MHVCLSLIADLCLASHEIWDFLLASFSRGRGLLFSEYGHLTRGIRVYMGEYNCVPVK